MQRSPSGLMVRSCRVCKNWRKRVFAAKRKNKPIPPRPFNFETVEFFAIPHRSVIDHDRCVPGESMCGECESLWHEVVASISIEGISQTA